MMNYEGYDQGEARALVSPCASAPCRGLYDDGLVAYALTQAAAVQAVRDRLCPVSAWWCTATASEIINRVCNGTEQLFVGTGCGSDYDIRCGLGCPTAAQVAACGSCTTTPPPPAGGMNTALVVGGLVVVGALAFYIASQGKKKVIIARVEK